MQFHVINEPQRCEQPGSFNRRARAWAKSSKFIYCSIHSTYLAFRIKTRIWICTQKRIFQESVTYLRNRGIYKVLLMPPIEKKRLFSFRMTGRRRMSVVVAFHNAVHAQGLLDPSHRRLSMNNDVDLTRSITCLIHGSVTSRV